jgi:hypothetical protein
MSAKIPVKASKPGKDTVYVDVDDEITAIIDKIEAAKQKIVALVLPKRATALQSIVNMRLLKRSADNASKNVVLITSETALLPLAGAAGLHVAKNLQSKPVIPPSPLDGKETPAKLAEEEIPEEDLDAVDEGKAKLDYHRTVGELAAGHELVDDPDAIPIDDEQQSPAGKSKTPKNKGLKVPNYDRFRLLLGLGAAAFVGLILFIILAIFVLPKATIAIQTSSSPVSANLSLKASGSATKLDEKNGIIPSVSKTSKQKDTQSSSATGKKNNGDKATGNVSMTAKDCVPFSGTPGDVPAGTGIGSNGLFYITQQNAHFTIDHGSGNCIYYKSGSVPIVAQSGGEKYNVSGATFTISNRPDVTGTGSASGGTDDITTVVSQQDVDNAKAKITDQDKEKFTKDFVKQLSDDGLYVLAATLRVSDAKVTASPAVGQEASSTTVTSQISYRVMAVKKDDLKKFIIDALNKQIDKKKQKINEEDVLNGASIDVLNQSSATNATLSIAENTDAVPIIDAAAVKSLAKGQKRGDIEAALNAIPGVKKVDVKFSPFWVSKAPKNTGKITVKLEHVATDNSSGN